MYPCKKNAVTLNSFILMLQATLIPGVGVKVDDAELQLRQHCIFFCLFLWHRIIIYYCATKL